MSEESCGTKRRVWGLVALLVTCVAVAGAVALVRAWPSMKVRSLIHRLEEPERRMMASQELISLGERAVPALCDVVRDPAHPARSDAVELLGRIGSPAALPALLALDDPSLARLRLEALGRLRGDDAERVVLAALAGPDPELSLTALGVLEEWPDPQGEHAPLLLPLLSHAQAGFRWTAAAGLGARKWAPAVQPLIARLADPDALVREKAARALSQIGTKEAVAAVDDAMARGAVSFDE